MKQGTTIEALVTEVARIAETKKDYVVDTRTMMLTTEPGIDAGETRAISYLTASGLDADLRVLDYAHGQIAAHAKIPKPFYDRLRGSYVDVLDTTVNRILHQEPSKQMLRTIDGKCRAFLSDRYRRLDNYDLLTHAVPALAEVLGGAPDAHVESCALTDERLYLSVIFPMWTAEIRVGDPVKLGVRISNSEVGSGKCSVETILYRLVCKNGMVTQHALRRAHVGRRVEADEDLTIYSDETLRLDDAAFFAKVADAIRACASEARFEQIVSEMRDLAGLRVEADPPAAVELLSNRVGFTEGEKGAVLRHLIEGGDLSAWGYVNAVTRTAQDADSYDRSMEIEKIGGKLASGELVSVLAA